MVQLCNTLHILRWAVCLVSVFVVVSARGVEGGQAAVWPSIPKTARTWQRLHGQGGLPGHDISASGALVSGWEGQGVLNFAPTAEVPLNWSTGVRGRYRVSLGCVVGGTFPALQVWQGEMLLAECRPDTAEARPQVLTFKASTGGPSGETLLLRPVGGGACAVFMLDSQLLSYEPVPAGLWQVTGASGGDPAKLPELLAAEQGYGYPQELDWRKPKGQAKASLAGVSDDGLALAVIHFHNPNPFTSYGFRLWAEKPAVLFANGRRFASVDAGQTVASDVVPYHKMGRNGFSRLVVAMAAKDAGNFELGVSPLHGARFCDHVPAQFVLLDAQTPAPPPPVTISNGIVAAELPMPDVHTGVFRGTRFEAAGMTSALTAFGHNFVAEFGEARQAVPSDHGTGTAEAFFEPVGYDDAKPGEPFIKLGVGLLERPSSSAYFFGAAYRVLKLFDWDTKVEAGKAAFAQNVDGPRGWGYRYEKRLVLPEGKSELRIEHTLTNTGTKRIVTSQYSHNFILIDGQKSDGNYQVTFGFRPVVLRDLKALKPKGNTFTPTAKTFFSPLAGAWTAAQNSVSIALGKDGPSIDVKGDFPLSKLWFFGNETAICPEPFVRIDLAPGASTSWTRTYTLKPGKQETP